MASVGHVLVGVAGAELSRRGQATRWSPFSAAVVWSGLSLLPDADVLGFRLGVHYEDPWGHRGATHSLVFAVMVAGVALAFSKAAGFRALRTALIVLVVAVSHPLLDTLTDGGLGCALLWPFSNERFFAPWTPLPVAPIGRAFLSAEGLRVAATELAVLSPLVVYLLWSVLVRDRNRDRDRPNGPLTFLMRARSWMSERRRREAAIAGAIDRAVAEFRRTRETPPMGAHVLRLDDRGAIVRVMFMTDHIPPDRAWFSVSPTGVSELSFEDVAHLETPWR